MMHHWQVILEFTPHCRSNVDRLKRNNRYVRRGGSPLRAADKNNSRTLSDRKHVHGKVTVKNSSNTAKHGFPSAAAAAGGVAGKGGRAITRDVLSSIVPKSADSYVKLPKVIHNKIWISLASI